MYVEYRIPAKQTHPYPIIIVHGGTRSGANWTGTSDGREGWAQYFVRRGYAVYVVDQPGRGRSAYVPEVYGPPRFANAESAQQRYLQQAKYKLWPQAQAAQPMARHRRDRRSGVAADHRQLPAGDRVPEIGRDHA